MKGPDKKVSTGLKEKALSFAHDCGYLGIKLPVKYFNVTVVSGGVSSQTPDHFSCGNNNLLPGLLSVICV